MDPLNDMHDSTNYRPSMRPARRSLSPMRALSTLLLLGGAGGALTAPPLHARTPDLAATPTTAAHELGQSYLFIRVYEDSIVVRLELTTRDLEEGLALGWDPDAGVSNGQLQAQLRRIRDYIEPRFSLETVDGPLDARFRSAEVRFLEISDFVMLNYVIEGTGGIPDEITATYPVLFETDPLHRNLFIVEHNWKTGTFNAEIVAGIFSPGDPSQTLDLRESAAWRGFLAMIRQGVWHIWIGLDHILFLIALILPAVLVRKEGEWQPVTSFRRALINIVTIVTFFTIAHSVTLSVAALELVRLPSRLVESVIAGSIAAAAVANLMPKLRIKEAAIAFVFGLFHGFGFAHVLSEIGLGREHLVLSLLGFNIGVELGQVAIICLVFPLLFLLRKQRMYMWLLLWGSLGLIALASIWVYERVFDTNVLIVGTLRSLLGL